MVLSSGMLVNNELRQGLPENNQNFVEETL